MNLATVFKNQLFFVNREMQLKQLTHNGNNARNLLMIKFSNKVLKILHN